MSMFCFQCQEAARGTGCTTKGVCGKDDELALWQDLLVFQSKGVSFYAYTANLHGLSTPLADSYLIESLFYTITNANFDKNRMIQKIRSGFEIKEALRGQLLQAGVAVPATMPLCASWSYTGDKNLTAMSKIAGILNEENEDIRSLKELLVYGLKGMAAYAKHADNLGYNDPEVFRFIHRALALSLQPDIAVDSLLALVMECGQKGVAAMALLDKANTSSYGHPVVSRVKTGVGSRPGILISGHDLKDLEELLAQSEGSGVDVYTHSEMLPAHYYPAFSKYSHFVGNYGNAWWKQKEEFESFNGPILFTTNCIVPPSESYKSRIYTTGEAGFDGCTHIADRKNGQPKDFAAIIAHAKQCAPPVEIENGEIIGGFAHNQVKQLAGAVVDAVKSGKIKKFVVMAGCDGRHKTRDYYTDFATQLPQDSVVLTAGCAKYRYNKLSLGEIEGIPRVLDAGQCNDSYSLALTALTLKEAFGLDDINALPIVYNIAWYEQKAVIVLLALLSLGVKNIHLGPTLPAFLSPNVVSVLVEKFGIGGITTPEEDMALLMA